jgi:hypothetical protein
MKNNFLESYHLQGKDSSSIKLGAFYEEELVGVMTFSKPRISLGHKNKKPGVWELSRFAIKSNLKVNGLASKLLKFFERNYDWVEVYSFADRRWSQGAIYFILGFELDHYSGVNYWYVDRKIGVREHRFKYRKDNLKSFRCYKEDKTEFDIMNEEGYLRVFDCGNIKFVKTI